jgi:hypothetical protein
MVGVITSRCRLALLIVAALAAMSGVLVMGAVLPDEPPPATVVAVAAAVRVHGRRHHWVQRLHARLGDVGDAWRALLLGAPPAFL